MDSSILDSPEAQAIAQGSPMPASQDNILDSPEAHDIALQDKYGETGQQIKAGLEGVGQGLVGPLAPMAEKALGVKEEDIRGREEANPGTHLAGEIAGLAGPALLTGGESLAAKAASNLTQAGLLSKIGIAGGETLASRIGAAAAKGAIDNALIAGSDEASKMVLHDPTQSAESAAASVGMGALLGGGLGGALGAVFKVPSAEGAAQSSKAAQVLEEFKARGLEHMTEGDPVKSVVDELTNVVNSTTNAPVFGDEGIKFSTISKVLPDKVSDAMSDQINSNLEKLEEAARKLDGDPNQKYIVRELANYKQALNSEDPLQIYKATNELKQNIQGYRNYEKIPSLAQKDFVEVADGLNRHLIDGLEDSKVWGQAGSIQQDINKAFRAAQIATKEFKSGFMGKLNGEDVIDPKKIESYIKQASNGKAGLRSDKLSNYVDKMKDYRDALDKSYAKAGMENPNPPISLNKTMASMKQKTTGAALFDATLGKLLGEGGGRGMGAGAGALMGSVIGHPEVGAIIGERALGPFFASTMPALAKRFLGSQANGEAFKAATGFTSAVFNGVKAANVGTKALFKAGTQVLPANAYPSREDRSKLESKVLEFQKNPDKLLDQSTKGKLDHYLPEHNSAINEIAARAIQYLNTLRPSTDKQSPLDSTPVPSAPQKAAYNNALDLINQPLLILDKIKSGVLSNADIQAVQSVYPSLFSGLQSKVQSEMINAMHDGATIPYSMKMALSLFTGQTLDSTMSQPSIVAAQPQPQQPQTPPQGGAKRGGVKSSPALQKMPHMYQTTSQSVQLRQQKDK